MRVSRGMAQVLDLHGGDAYVVANPQPATRRRNSPKHPLARQTIFLRPRNEPVPGKEREPPLECDPYAAIVAGRDRVEHASRQSVRLGERPESSSVVEHDLTGRESEPHSPARVRHHCPDTLVTQCGVDDSTCSLPFPPPVETLIPIVEPEFARGALQEDCNMAGIYAHGYKANFALLELRASERRREKESAVAGARTRADTSAKCCLGARSRHSVQADV